MEIKLNKLSKLGTSVRSHKVLTSRFGHRQKQNKVRRGSVHNGTG